MAFDVTVVLFSPDWELFDKTTRGLFGQGSEVRKLWILASAGADPSHRRVDYPKNVVWVEREDNLGFAAGHNHLLQMAFEDGAQCALVLNPDIELPEGALAQFRRSIEGGQVPFPCLHAPRLVLASRDSVSSESTPPVIDSDGIIWSRDRRHFDLHQGSSFGPLEGSRDVAGVSGAALAVRSADWRAVRDCSGFFFDPLFVAYREDAELGLRVARMGGGSRVHLGVHFVHARGSLNAARGSALQRMLGVRNRFLLKPLINGDPRFSRIRGGLRDLVVVAAVSTVERTSFTGLRAAWALRGTMRYRRRRVEVDSRSS